VPWRPQPLRSHPQLPAAGAGRCVGYAAGIDEHVGPSVPAQRPRCRATMLTQFANDDLGGNVRLSEVRPGLVLASPSGSGASRRGSLPVAVVFAGTVRVRRRSNSPRRFLKA
jgi:hypothetical protein